MANMQEIARMAGVSLGTVSHVLNNSAKVRESTRKRVLEAVQLVGYQPSQLARGLRRDKTNMIGMIIPDITNPFFPAVVRGAEDVAFSNGYRLILCNTDNDHSKEIIHLNELRTYLPAGLIVIPSNFSDLTTQAEYYRRAGAGVVCIDRLPKNWSGDSVTSDNEAGAYNATRHLIQLGHTRLATITGPLHLTNAAERLEGFKRAMKEAKLHLSPEYVQETSFDKQGGHAKTLVLLRLIPRPTAIFAGNDMIALGALLAIREAGLRCPEEISLMGFDDLDLAETTNPSLSSVSQPGYQLGTTAARLLLDRREGDTSPAKHIVLETLLHLRNSVSPPPDVATVGSSMNLIGKKQGRR
ncbi:transcriptional regulator, LacI family [Bryocella elongata]|uniref:Transcriptional regulator, LacI family n=1 Tax=Bryocella elongata TaxID=863522 RepID=A0A1H5UPN7_9BACT|nr:LacI family DNA-binding transcriptional regulator [Bryocella elongata]SEF76990.1 transcriptional regulator, LacI family [Bryocella elongata]